MKKEKNKKVDNKRIGLQSDGQVKANAKESSTRKVGPPSGEGKKDRLEEII
jgi:hypothetical protein